ncbi:MAG: hypothetical protein ACI90V_009939, partial [Bacillariaceae sp.]
MVIHSLVTRVLLQLQHILHTGPCGTNNFWGFA